MGSVLGFPGIDPRDAAVGARIRRWRGQRGVDLIDLAAALGLSIEAARRAEAGREHLSLSQLTAATTCLQLPLWSLVSDTPAY